MGDQIDTSRNLLIVPDNRMDDPRGTGAPATLSGGAWIAARPLANLLDARLMVAAQSDGLDPAATRWTIDYGAETDLRVCVVWASVSRAGRIRRTISLDPDGHEIIHDSGWRDWIPQVMPAWTLPRAHPSYGHGRIPERELRQYRLFWHDLTAEPILGRYEHVQIEDGGNADGHIRVARCWTGAGWQASIPVEFGCSWGWEDPSDIGATLSGRTDADLRPRHRTMAVTFDGLPQDEALSHVYDMLGRKGIAGQMYVSWDPMEVMHRHRRSGLCRMQALSSVELAIRDWVNGGFKFIEEVA